MATRARGRELYEHTLAITRRLGDEWAVAHMLTNLATVTMRLGEAAAAASLFEEARETFSRLGDALDELWCKISLAEALHYQRDRRRSRQLLAEGLAGAIATGRRRTLAEALTLGGLIALDEGDLREAHTFLGTALQISEEHLGREDMAADLTLLAASAAAAGDGRRAAQLLGAAIAVKAQTGEALGPLIDARFERTADEVRAALGEAEFDEGYAAGRSAPDDAIHDAAGAATGDLQALIDYVAAERPLTRAG